MSVWTAEAVRQGLVDGVVDELTLSWVPVILEKGITLFAGLRHRSAFEVDGGRRLPSSLVQFIYRPVR